MPNKKVLFRFEIWINPSFKTEENIVNHPLSKLKEFLKDNFGGTIDEKNINV